MTCGDAAGSVDILDVASAELTNASSKQLYNMSNLSKPCSTFFSSTLSANWLSEKLLEEEKSSHGTILRADFHSQHDRILQQRRKETSSFGVVLSGMKLGHHGGREGFAKMDTLRTFFF